MSIVLRSGSVSGVSAIRGAARRAALKAVARATAKAFGDLYPTIAKRTTKMARSMRIRIKRVAPRAALTNITEPTITIAYEDVKRFLERATTYAQYHIQENGYPKNYQNPTTPGTFRISVLDFMADISREIRRELPRQLRVAGLNAT